jgi:hypothetical protein
MKVIRGQATRSAKVIADDVRKNKVATMVEEGVNQGSYTLHDVNMLEESISGKTFYALTYRTHHEEQDVTYDQYSRFYLLFPKKQGNTFFVYAHYTEFCPTVEQTVPSQSNDVQNILTTLEIQEESAR